MKLPSKEDKAFILELLETLPLKEVGEKFEIRYDDLSKILKEWGTSVPKLRKAFRIKYMQDNPKEDCDELAESWNCSVSVVYSLKKALRDNLLTDN